MTRFFIYILFVFVTAACSDKTPDGCDGRTVAVTIEPYRCVVEAVAGDKWGVVTVVPKGGNPETFDPTPATMTSLSGCKAYFMVGGLGFEDAWKRTLADIYPDMPLVDTSCGISRCDDDPHLWTSPDNMIQIARNVCDAFCVLDSADSAGYKARTDSFVTLVQHDDKFIRERLAGCRDVASFVIFHPTLTYFSRLYGLNQIAIEHEGKEPSAAHIRAVVDSARRRGVETVLVQAEFDRRNAEAVASEIGAEVIVIDPLCYDWHSEMRRIAEILGGDER